MKAPLISIITVTYNDADGLRDTMRSVASQSASDYEHLVIDGASTDNTPEVIAAERGERTRLRSEPDRGIYDAMNKGLADAEGDYVIFLNAGDTFHSTGTLSDIIRVIRDNDMPGVVYGQTDIVDGDDRHLVGERHLRAPETLTLDSFKQGMVVCHQAFVALRRIVSRYNLTYKYSADYEWCLRILQHSRNNVYIPDVLVDYRRHGASTEHRLSSLWERYRIMCYYYGTVGTTLRHLKFAGRAASRYFKEKKNNNN